MKGKVVVVTGANGGLGRAVTSSFLNAGANVVGVARSISASEFGDAGFTPMAADISDLGAAMNIAQGVMAKFRRIDVLAHLVGGFAGGQTIDELDVATWERMMFLNATAAFYMFRAVLPHMTAAKAGRIIAIASRAAVDPGVGVGAYSASKAAVASLVRTVAMENKDKGVTANAILPGTIDTAANRAAMPTANHSSWIQPESIAALLLWLASDAGAQVTGAAIPIYGAQL